MHHWYEYTEDGMLNYLGEFESIDEALQNCSSTLGNYLFTEEELDEILVQLERWKEVRNGTV